MAKFFVVRGLLASGSAAETTLFARSEFSGKQRAPKSTVFLTGLQFRTRPPPAWIGFVLMTGGVLSLATFLTLKGWEQREVEKRAASLVREQVERVQGDVLRSMEVLHSIASLYAAHGSLKRKEFHAFVQSALARQPEIQALSWNPVVSELDRSNLEARAVADGITGYEFRELSESKGLHRSDTRAHYVPVLFIEPLQGNDAALGYDLNSDASRRLALEQARDTGQAVATKPVHLAQVPVAEPGFLVLLPVYWPGPFPLKTRAQRREQVTGFAVAVFRMTNLVSPAIEKLRDEGIAAAVFDASNPNEPLLSNVVRTTGFGLEEAARSVPLEVANRNWTLRYVPTASFRAAQLNARSWLVLGGGLAFTAVTTAYLWLAWRQTRRIADANSALQQEVGVRQKAEAAAEAANRAKSDFLASMSHEIRTPLNAILGYAQLLQRDHHISPEQKDGLVCIGTSGQHLLGLINEILDLSKIEAGRMELNPSDFDLGELGRSLAATFQPLCAEKGIAFRQVLDDAAKRWVWGDEGKLRQVLINLLGNAFKFTAAGEVFLRIKSEENDHWLFEVIDTGQGIPEEERGRIFEPFHRGSNVDHQGGTGLGLAIAQRQVDLLGGLLQLQSERGIGSRFYFSIKLSPALPGTKRQSDAAPMERLKAGCRVRALVVDDRRENREVLGRMLELAGCEVALASSGKDALRAARERGPQIVFLDLLMPGLDGVATAREMLSDPRCGTPKIVAHSAAALPRYREQARQAGCVDFVPKPIRSEQVYECLRIHLGVEFDGVPQMQEPEVLPPWDGAPVKLSGDLYARLTTAAELHSTTTLKTCLHELRLTGLPGQQLSQHIRHLMRSYDMEGISRLIERATVPEPGNIQSNAAYGPATVEEPAP